MFLEFNDEQLELRESARATLSRQCPPSLVRAVADGTGDAAELETEIGWLGWPALTIDVDVGGRGGLAIGPAAIRASTSSSRCGACSAPIAAR